MPKFTPPVLRGLLKKPGRHPDGEAKGLYFRAVGDGKAYWVYRYRVAGREREMSLGPYPEVKLDEARAKHAVERAKVLNKSDPLAGKRNGKAAPTAPSGKPTFGEAADKYVATHEGGWRNSKHRWQWTQTLTQHCGPIRDMPVDQIGTDDILAVLTPLWAARSVTASRLRGRIERVLNAARALGHIDKDRANPARWKAHLDELLPKPKKLARGHHAAMPYAETPAFVERLRAMNSTAALALEFVILTASRSGETLGARWEEIDFVNAVFTIPPGRMKTNEAFSIPLSDRALAILRTLEATRGENPIRVRRSAATSAQQHGAGDAVAPDGCGRDGSWDADLISHVVFRGRPCRVRDRRAMSQPPHRLCGVTRLQPHLDARTSQTPDAGLGRFRHRQGRRRHHPTAAGGAVIRIAISQAAFDAIPSTLQ